MKQNQIITIPDCCQKKKKKLYLITSRVMLKMLKLSGSSRRFWLSVIEIKKTHIAKNESCETKNPLFFLFPSFPV